MGHALAQRAKVFPALELPKELRLEGGDLPVVDGLLSPPHTEVCVSGFEGRWGVPARLLALPVEALAHAVDGPAQREDHEGRARSEVESRPCVGGQPRQVLARQHRSIVRVEGLGEGPLEAREICSVGAAPGKNPGEGFCLEEMLKRSSGVAQRRMGRRMGQEVGLHQVVERGGAKRPGEGAEVAAQGVLDPDKIGMGVDPETVLRREPPVSPQQP